MKVNAVHIGMCAVIAPEGRLDLAGADALDAAIEAEHRKSIHHFAIDLKRVDFISSAGLRVLLKLARTLLSSGGELRVVKPPTAVYEIFENARLDQLFTFYISLDQALQNWTSAGVGPQKKGDSAEG
ncbi:MAG: STAS domain-containing protein [Candidatus Sumerlaeia bacterium]|nr:STAS domain-containing protein [Candidatus Sumerlaeia bacterium]